MGSRTITITSASQVFEAYEEVLEIVNRHYNESPTDRLSDRLQNWQREVIDLKKECEDGAHPETWVVQRMAEKIEELASEILCNTFSSDNRIYRHPVLDRERVTWEQKQLENYAKRKFFSPKTGNPASTDGMITHVFVKEICDWVRKYRKEEPSEEEVWLERSEADLALARSEAEKAQRELALQQQENELARLELESTLNNVLGVVQERLTVTNANTNLVREQAAALVQKSKEHDAKKEQLHKEQTTLLGDRITKAEVALEELETKSKEDLETVTAAGVTQLQELGASAQAKIEEGQEEIGRLGQEVNSLAEGVNGLNLKIVSKDAEHGQRMTYMEEEALRQEMKHDAKVRQMEDTISSYSSSLSASYRQVDELKSTVGGLQDQVKNQAKEINGLRQDVQNADSGGGGCVVM